ncbi:hypothetical protein ILYODFUR_034027 [Ilyodon furcidens]|uniref:Uncharacterized protein n=1 Tax=Ilyodon furcidens TaxID=33524 RepID=A0ABV0VJC1_9TELE
MLQQEVNHRKLSHQIPDIAPEPPPFWTRTSFISWNNTQFTCFTGTVTAVAQHASTCWRKTETMRRTSEEDLLLANPVSLEQPVSADRPCSDSACGSTCRPNQSVLLGQQATF